MGVLVDDRFYDFEGNNTIFQFCLKKGINLPCFCYHERLSIAGNCRICLVEVNTVLVVSCAISLMDHMVIHTKNKRVRRSRESILEFLLVNHPLDCPICDQGGECDLQDIVINYGSDRGRFYETVKRSVDNLNCCGPLIKTIMTRCIHCTRCVRFMQEIAGVFDLGVIGRGNNMEIGVYIEKLLYHELIGNIIDLCPVGALTSMPFSFSARP
jgi:NADH dehydrogenase/NADH:ubiquinone oxidoreductase subunit G